MKCKVKMPNGKIEEREIEVINPNPLEDFASGQRHAGRVNTRYI